MFCHAFRAMQMLRTSALILCMALLGCEAERHSQPRFRDLKQLETDLSDSNMEIRKRAVSALRTLGLISRFALRQALRNDNHEVRMAAAQSLLEMKAIPELIVALSSEDEKLRHFTVQKVLDNPEYLHRCIYVADHDEEMSNEFNAGLLKVGPAAIPALVSMLPHRISRAPRLLAQIGNLPDSAIQALNEAYAFVEYRTKVPQVTQFKNSLGTTVTSTDMVETMVTAEGFRDALDEALKQIEARAQH